MALLVSASAHAIVAVTAAGIIRSASPGSPGQADPIDIDVMVAANLSDTLPPAVTAMSDPPRREEAPRRPEARHPSTPKSVASRVASRISGDALADNALTSPSVDVATTPVLFALSAGTVATRAAVGVSSGTVLSTAAAGAADLDGADALAEGAVSVPARLLATAPLVYPPAARKAEIEVDLPLEIVVDRSGHVSAARGLTRAGFGLDEAAVEAIQGYRFSPALRGGHPVRVRMRWTVQFRLR
jgi:TonB family protein